MSSKRALTRFFVLDQVWPPMVSTLGCGPPAPWYLWIKSSRVRGT